MTAAAAAAHADGGFYARARVTEVDPVYVTDTQDVPHRICHTETVARRGNNPVGMVIGGVVGGLLGNQVGQGNGNKVAIAAGAATGAIVGDRMGSQSGSQEVNRCYVQHETRRVTRISGYRVTYDYSGHDYTTVVNYRPGRTMPVVVNVAPAPQPQYGENDDGGDRGDYRAHDRGRHRGWRERDR